MGNGDSPQSAFVGLHPWTLILLCVLGSATGGGASTAIFARPDPFTGSMGEELRREMLSRLEGTVAGNELALERMEWSIRTGMPPVATRRRIVAIERYLSECSGDGEIYEPPTLEW